MLSAVTVAGATLGEGPRGGGSGTQKVKVRTESCRNLLRQRQVTGAEQCRKGVSLQLSVAPPLNALASQVG